MTDGKAIFPVDQIENRILLIRGERVVLDTDLAAFYGVTTRRLNEQVKRNRARFPAEFAFLLSAAEKAEVVAYCDHLKKLKYSRCCPSLLRSTVQLWRPMFCIRHGRWKWGYWLFGLS